MPSGGRDRPDASGSASKRSGDNQYPPALKRLGQHFLTDVRILSKIADALALTGSETVIEIGAGRGALTDLLVSRAARVVAVELDRALAELLRRRYADDVRVTVVEQDILKADIAQLAGGGYVLAGNVPYYITTPILFNALRPPRPARMVFLVQREVAIRLAAAPGGKEYGALSVNAQTFAHVELVARVPAGAFNPPPKVESAVVRLVPREDPLVAGEDEESYRRFVQGAFGLRRKQFVRVVRTLLNVGPDEAHRLLESAAIEPTSRPETLDVAGWVRLYGEARALNRDL